MKPKNATSKRRLFHNRIVLWLCGLATAIMLIGCTGGYGRLNWDPQVTAASENHDIQQGFNCYYYGAGNQTYAIAGISTEYNIESRIWREVPQDAAVFKNVVSRAWENYAYKPYDPQGAHILNPGGNRVGVWYSSLCHVTVKFGENNRIHLRPDTPFLGGPEADSNSADNRERISALEPTP